MLQALRTPLLCLLGALTLAACSTASVTTREDAGPTIREAQAVSALGERKRIAVKPFVYKGTGNRPALGKGLSEMLTDALFNSNRFIVLERERIDEVMAEQDLGDSGRFRQETVAPKGELEGAEFLIRGSITQFEPDCRGASLLLIGAKQACLAINLRIIDVKTGRVVNATTVEGTSGSGGVGLIFTTSPLPIGLGAWAKTPVEKAFRNTIEAAVKHIVETKL